MDANDIVALAFAAVGVWTFQYGLFTYPILRMGNEPGPERSIFFMCLGAVILGIGAAIMLTVGGPSK